MLVLFYSRLNGQIEDALNGIHVFAGALALWIEMAAMNVSPHCSGRVGMINVTLFLCPLRQDTSRFLCGDFAIDRFDAQLLQHLLDIFRRVKHCQCSHLL